MGKSVPHRKSFRSTVYSHIQNVDSHIDNVKNSLQNLVFSNERETERVLLKKRITVVVIVTVLLMILGSFLSPKGKAEVATFYPTSCLGGWNNPRNAEGEPQVKNNDDEAVFTKENSAILPANTRADIYCGGFVGNIEENTKPVKILVALSWSKGENIILEQTITGESFASSSGEILDIASTTEVSFTLSTSTEATPTSTIDISEDTPAVKNIINAIEDIFEGLFNNESTSSSTEEESPVIESNVNTTTKEQTPTEVPVSDTVPQVETTPNADNPPTSFLYRFLDRFTLYFVWTVFAEEASTTPIELTEAQTEVVVASDNNGSTSTDITDQAEEPIEVSTTSIQISEATTTATTTPSESTSTLSFIEAFDIITDDNDEDQSPNNFIEVLYTFDGVTWKSLGKVNESSMKYRTFEIPVTATTSWGDMDQLQIKVQSLQRIDDTPAVYLDGIQVDVLYETPIIHDHPDFARDTVLKDKTDDGVRVISIINSDTNNNEIWYTTVRNQGEYGVAPGSWVKVQIDSKSYSYKLIEIYGQNIFWVDDSGKMLWVSNLEKGTNDGMALIDEASTTATFIKSNGEEWIFEYNNQTKIGAVRIKN